MEEPFELKDLLEAEAESFESKVLKALNEMTEKLNILLEKLDTIMVSRGAGNDLEVPAVPEDKESVIEKAFLMVIHEGKEVPLILPEDIVFKIRTQTIQQSVVRTLLIHLHPDMSVLRGYSLQGKSENSRPLPSLTMEFVNATMRKLYTPNVNDKLDLKERDKTTRNQLSKVLNSLKTDFDESGHRKARPKPPRNQTLDASGAAATSSGNNLREESHDSETNEEQ